MSNYVDERIVEMKFDNQNFEKNVQVSLKTLEELNKQLKLEDAGKSFESIQNASSKIDLSNLANNVQAVADRCSFLGIVGDEVIRRLTNGFMDLNQAVISTVKSLTIDQIGVGFDKYERKVQSVQTIMNATGKSIDEVSVALDKLNWFTDETSYSYADMVDNISKFTSSNVDLDTAVTSMIGIADAAGLAGATTQDASHAMEGFSKAIAQGYMSRQNWQWIRTAHMDTTKFKDVLIQAAVAEGTLTKALDGTFETLDGNAVTIADFESALKDGWMTTNAINRALSEFGGTTEEIYKEYQRTGALTSDIIKSMGVDVDDLGLKSFRAAQEAKTFSDAINSVKDAVSTGWMVSFEQIFGNYEQARKFWTDVANEMWDIFASGGESRNELFSNIFSGSFNNFQAELSSMGVSIDKFEESLKGIAENSSLDVNNLVSTYGSLSEAFRAGAISGDMAKDALRSLANEMSVTSTESVDLTEKLAEIKGKVNEVISGVYGNGEARRQALEELGYSYEYIQGLVNQILLEGREITLDDVKIFEQEIQTMTGLTEEQRKALLAFIDGNEEANASFDELIENMSKKTGQELIHGMILNLLGGIKDVQEAFRSASETVFGGSEKRAEFIYSLLEKLHSLSERFRLTEESSENLQKTISGLLSILKFFIATGEKLLYVLSPIKGLFNLSGESVLEFTGNLGEAVTEFVKWYESSEEAAEVTDRLRGYIERLVDVLRKIITFIKGLAEKFIPVIKNGLNSIKKTISNSPLPGFLKRIKDRIRDLWRYIEKIDFESVNVDLSGFSGFISSAADAILALYNAIKEYLSPYIDKIKDAFSNFNVVIDPVKEKINKFRTEISESGGVIAYFRSKISEVKTAISDFVKNGGLGKLFDSFTESFGPVKEKLNKFLEDISKELENVDWGAVLAFSVGFSLVPAILSISAAFTEAAKLFKTGKGVLSTINGIFTKFKNGLKSTVQEIAEAAVAFSIAIAILAGAIWLLATKVEHGDLLRAATILTAVMGAFLIMTAGIAAAIHFLKVDPKAMLGILAFAGAIGILAVSLKVLQDVKINLPQIGAILGLMVALGIAAVALSKFGVKLDGVGLYFLTFAGAILLLAVALEKIGNIPAQQLNASLSTITDLMLSLGVVVAASRLVKGSGFGILALVGAVFLITKLLEKLGDNKINELLAKASENWVAITFLLGTVLAFTILLGHLQNGGNAAKIGVGVALMAASLMIVVKAIEMFAKINTADLIKGGSAVVVILATFALIAAAMNSGKGEVKGNGALAGVGIAVMAASLLIVYQAVKQFAKLKVSDLKKGMQCIIAIFGLYAALIAITALTKNAKTGPIVAMIVALGTIVASLVILTMYDFNKLIPGVISIGLLLLAFAASLRIINKTEFDGTKLGALLAMCLALGEIAAALYFLADKDWENLAAAALSISGCLAVFSLALKSISGVEFDVMQIVAFGMGILAVYFIGMMLEKVGALPWEQSLAAATAIGGVLLAIAGALALSSKFGDLKGVGILILAVAGIGAVLIGLAWLAEKVAESTIDGFATVSEKLPKIGENIKSLFDSLSTLPEVDPNIGEIFKNIGLGFAALTAAEFIDNINKFLNGGKGAFDDLGPKMESFGAAMNTMSDSLPSKAELEKIVVAMDALYDIAYVLQDFPKNTDWKKLNTNLSKFGEAMYDYGVEVDGLNYTAIANSVSSVQNIVKIADMLPTAGGLIAVFTGKTDWDGISDNLWDFGYAIKSYGEEVENIKIDSISNSVSAVKDVTNIANMIPLTGGFIGVFAGHTDWEGITDNLEYFGSAIVGYGITVKNLETGAIETSVAAVDNIISIVESILGSNAFIKLSNGEFDMERFEIEIAAYARGLRDFSTIANDIDYDSLSKASDLKLIGENFGISIVSGIKGTESDIIKAISKLLNSAFDVANRKASSFYPIGAEISQSIASGILSNFKSIDDAMSDYTKLITSEIDSLMKELPSAINNGEAGIVNSVTTILVSCINKLRGSYSEFVSASAYLAGGFGSGFVITSVDYSIGQAIDNCIYTIRSYYYSFYYAGRYLILGLANGISENGYIANNATKQLARDMYNTFADYNEINSPSRLYAKLGKYIPEGLARGVENNTGVAADATSSMGYEMIAAITPALAMLADLVSGDFEISPQIRPVVDLSEVYASTEAISDLFAQKNVDTTARVGSISGSIRNVESARYENLHTDSDPNSRSTNQVFNTYIYTQPGQNTEEIANEVERRMVRNLSQRRTAFAQ